jgi:hypothetical protein
VDFPPLPVPGELLINDPFWRYPSACRRRGHRAPACLVDGIRGAAERRHRDGARRVHHQQHRRHLQDVGPQELPWQPEELLAAVRAGLATMAQYETARRGGDYRSM